MTASKCVYLKIKIINNTVALRIEEEYPIDILFTIIPEIYYTRLHDIWCQYMKPYSMKHILYTTCEYNDDIEVFIRYPTKLLGIHLMTGKEFFYTIYRTYDTEFINILQSIDIYIPSELKQICNNIWPFYSSDEIQIYKEDKDNTNIYFVKDVKLQIGSIIQPLIEFIGYESSTETKINLKNLLLKRSNNGYIWAYGFRIKKGVFYNFKCHMLLK